MLGGLFQYIPWNRRTPIIPTRRASQIAKLTHDHTCHPLDRWNDADRNAAHEQKHVVDVAMDRHVMDVMQNEEHPDVVTVKVEAGDLILFAGRYSMHRVSECMGIRC